MSHKYRIMSSVIFVLLVSVLIFSVNSSIAYEEADPLEVATEFKNMIIDKIDKRERKRKDVEWFRDASDKASAIQLALTPCSVPNDPRCAPGNTQVKDALNTIRELRTMISEEIARRKAAGKTGSGLQWFTDAEELRRELFSLIGNKLARAAEAAAARAATQAVGLATAAATQAEAIANRVMLEGKVVDIIAVKTGKASMRENERTKVALFCREPHNRRDCETYRCVRHNSDYGFEVFKLTESGDTPSGEACGPMKDVLRGIY